MRARQGPNMPYSVVAGVLPIQSGWLVASAKLRGATFATEEPMVLPSFRDVLDRRPGFANVVVNAPIGYLDHENDGRRTCDVEAQEIFKARVGAIPVAPTREALDRVRDGNIALATIDDFLFERYLDVAQELSTSNQRFVYEGNPELSFYQLNGYELLPERGASNDGSSVRRELLDRTIPGATRIIDAELVAVSPDDLENVTALLWTARRVFGHSALRLPAEGEWDSEGFRMELVM